MKYKYEESYGVKSEKKLTIKYLQELSLTQDYKKKQCESIRLNFQDLLRGRCLLFLPQEKP